MSNLTGTRLQAVSQCRAVLCSLRHECEKAARILHENLVECRVADARVAQPGHECRDGHVNAGAAVLPQILRAREIRRQEDPIFVASLEQGQNRANVFVETRVVRFAGMVEAEIGTALGDREGRGQRVLLDVVQMANDDLPEICAGGLQNVDLLEGALRTPIGGVSDDRQTGPDVRLCGRLKRLALPDPSARPCRSPSRR
jgi:hypothetical protein